MLIPFLSNSKIRLYPIYFVSIAITLCISSCSIKRILPVLVTSETWRKYDTTGFAKFIFEYNKKVVGGRYLDVTAFKEDGTIIEKDRMPLREKVPGKKLYIKDLPLDYKGHIEISKATIRQLLIDNRIDLDSNYVLIPKQMERNGKKLHYVSYSLNSLHPPSESMSPSEKKINKYKLGGIVLETLDPSPPAD